MEQTRIAIEGMSCGHCVAGVRRALEGLQGVEVREVTIGSATVAYDSQAVTPGEITGAVEAEGYPAQVAEG